MSSFERSHIILAEEIEERFEAFKKAVHPSRVVGFVRDDFLIEDAKAVIAEAYISEASLKYVVLAAKQFNIYSQNALLKLLEEPPTNIALVIIAPSKSVLLPTVRSRLPILNELSGEAPQGVELTLGSLDLGALYGFVTSVGRMDRHESKALIERLFYQASVVEKLPLSTEQLDAFARAFRLLEVNARLQNVLLTVLMPFLPEQRRAG
ncbi:DNA polymerase III subunit delta' [Sulfurimonas diazotrophicus]|uniref:DNA polymerase III subunit delta n=1 Tax=Sulfurimonas diazotrophicus TaxID=3131939 RepID=A0ABZ3H827_9BACT